MNGILILAHGSRRPEADKDLNSLIQKVIKKTGEQLIFSAYLHFSEQNLQNGVEYLIEKGAKNIMVIPMFLFDGVHVTRDVPKELDIIMEKHPDIKVKMSRHLGDDDRIADIIADRIYSL